MTKYKIGEKVILRTGGNEYREQLFSHLISKVVTIDDLYETGIEIDPAAHPGYEFNGNPPSSNNWYGIKEDGGKLFWNEEWLDPVITKITFNNET